MGYIATGRHIIKVIFISDCGTDYKLDNGHVDFKGNPTTVGETFPLFCDPGFELEGDTDTTCLPDGTWSKLTKCRRKGKLSCTSILIMERLHYLRIQMLDRH